MWTNGRAESGKFSGGKCYMGVSKGRNNQRGPNDPVAIHTALGWVLLGPLMGRSTSLNECPISSTTLISTSAKQDTLLLEEEVSKLWDLDTIGICPENEVHEKLIDEISYARKKVHSWPPMESGT